MRGKLIGSRYSDSQADNYSTGSRRTCGRRSRKRWLCHGGRPKQCTGKSAKSKWPSEPTCPSSTLPVNKTQTPHQVPCPTADPAPLPVQFPAAQHTFMDTTMDTDTLTRTLTTTASRKSRTRCTPRYRQSKSAWFAATAAPARLEQVLC
jgi:hypothetical protein